MKPVSWKHRSCYRCMFQAYIIYIFGVLNRCSPVFSPICQRKKTLSGAIVVDPKARAESVSSSAFCLGECKMLPKRRKTGRTLKDLNDDRFIRNGKSQRTPRLSLKVVHRIDNGDILQRVTSVSLESFFSWLERRLCCLYPPKGKKRY